MWRPITLAAAILTVIASRLAHLRLVWIEEAYGLAAAAELMRSKRLYSDIWFDKPPLYAWFYMLCGSAAGWPLRLLDIVLVLMAAGVAFLIARQLWGLDEGILAFALLCFCLTFWIPSAVIAVAPDLLMVLPHLLAVYFAVRQQPWAAGCFAGMAVLCNSKGLSVLPVVLLWVWRSYSQVLGGFLATQGAMLLVLPIPEYWKEVWVWGYRYSGNTFLHAPFVEGVRRTLGWAGFHLFLCVATGVYWLRERPWKTVAWAAVAMASVTAGLRFFPRYYFALLPALTICAARGFMLMQPRVRAGAVLLLVIPVVRFGPRYASLALNGGRNWSDTALMEDSRRTGIILQTAADAGETLFVWGYRPDIYVFSGLPAGTRFPDSQPLTGVLADRHLVRSDATFPEIGRENRQTLVRTLPTFIVDGLGPLNPALDIAAYPDLRAWFSRYELIARTGSTAIYRRKER